MSKKIYAVSDPMHGIMHFVATEQEAKDKFFELMINFAMPYFGSHPYVEITTNDDGTDTWRNIEGDEIANVLPEGDIQSRFEQVKSHLRVMTVKDEHPADQPRPHTGEFAEKLNAQ